MVFNVNNLNQVLTFYFKLKKKSSLKKKTCHFITVVDNLVSDFMADFMVDFIILLECIIV